MPFVRVDSTRRQIDMGQYVSKLMTLNIPAMVFFNDENNKVAVRPDVWDS